MYAPMASVGHQGFGGVAAFLFSFSNFLEARLNDHTRFFVQSHFLILAGSLKDLLLAIFIT